jgi:hypothetical protein
MQKVELINTRSGINAWIDIGIMLVIRIYILMKHFQILANDHFLFLFILNLKQLNVFLLISEKKVSKERLKIPEAFRGRSL